VHDGRTAEERGSRRIVHRLRRRLTPWLMVAPVQLQLGLFLLVPAIVILWLSLNRSDYGQSLSFVGTENYHEILADPGFRLALINTVIVVNAVVYVEVLIALGAAALFRGLERGRAIFLAVVLTPYATSEVVAVLAWRFLADPNIGYIDPVLHFLGLGAVDWAVNRVHALLLVSVISIWLHFPFSFLLIYGAMLGIPASVIEAASIDGATAWQRFRRVTLPLLMPAILVTIVFRYIFAFRMFSEVWLLTKGGPARSTELLSVYLYKNAFEFSEFGTASATGWLMVIISLVLAMLYIVLLMRQRFDNG
jgi:multiple sugar transport system permease protein